MKIVKNIILLFTLVWRTTSHPTITPTCMCVCELQFTPTHIKKTLTLAALCALPSTTPSYVCVCVCVFIAAELSFHIGKWVKLINWAASFNCIHFPYCFRCFCCFAFI